MNYIVLFEIIKPDSVTEEWLMFHTLEELREYESRSTLHHLRLVYQIIELHDVTSVYREQ